MKFSYLLITLLLLTGCIPIMINENDYRGVKEEDKWFVKPFVLGIEDQNTNYNDTLFLYELNTGDIKGIIKDHPLTWIHLWRPFCHADQCQNIGYYAAVEEGLKDHGLRVLVVSETYDYNDIKGVVKNSMWNKPVFVLQDSYYGHKIRKNSLKLAAEMITDSVINTKWGYDDYLFKKSKLIYAGNGLDKNKIDSILLLSK